jgi:iron complex outermembrane receptor protein
MLGAPSILMVSLAPLLFPVQDPPPPQAPPNDARSTPDATPDEKSEFDRIERLRILNATFLDLPIARSPSAITVLTGEMIRRSGVRFLTDSFRLEPGLEVTRQSATDSNVSVRGFNADSSSSQGILALIDGRPVYNEFFGNVLWEALPVGLDDIQRVELVRGPESVVYGPNAMYGLVNIVTRSPLDYDQDELFMAGSAGSYDSTVGHAIFVRRMGDTGVKATLGWDSLRDFDPSIGTQKKKIFGELQVEKRLGEQTVQVTAGIDRQNLDTLITAFKGVPTTEFASDVQDQFVKVDYTVGNLRAFVSVDSWRSNSVPEAIYRPFSLFLESADAEATYTITEWTGHALTAGTGFRYSTFHTANEDISDGRHSTELGWFLVQDEIELSKDIWVTAGARLDKHSRTGTNVSPRLAVVWEFIEKQNLRASIGEGYRNPSLRDFWTNLPVTVGGTTVTLLGNPDLRSEENRSLELAYIGTPLERLRAEVTGYYSLIDRLVVLGDPVIIGGTPCFIPHNSGADKVYGVETQVQWLIVDNVSAFGVYSYGLREDRHTGDLNPNAPRNKGSVGTRWTFPGPGITGMLWASYFGAVDFDVPQTLHNPPYTLLNGRIAYTLKDGPTRAEAFLQGFNMLDKKHRENPTTDEFGALLMGGLNVSF